MSALAVISELVSDLPEVDLDEEALRTTEGKDFFEEARSGEEGNEGSCLLIAGGEERKELPEGDVISREEGWWRRCDEPIRRGSKRCRHFRRLQREGDLDELLGDDGE